MAAEEARPAEDKPVAEQPATSTEAETQERRTFGNNATTTFLTEMKGNAVIVKQLSGIEYHGTLQSVDGFLNVVLRNTREVYEGKTVSELGELFLRGSIVDYIALD